MGTTYNTGQAVQLKRSSWMHEVLVEVSGEAIHDNYSQLVASEYLLALECSNCFNTCQNNNTVQIVTVLVSLTTVKTPAGPRAYYNPHTCHRHFSIATFSGSRCKATRNSHKGLCHRKIWINIFEVGLVLEICHKWFPNNFKLCLDENLF